MEYILILAVLAFAVGWLLTSINPYVTKNIPASWATKSYGKYLMFLVNGAVVLMAVVVGVWAINTVVGKKVGV